MYFSLICYLPNKASTQCTNASTPPFPVIDHGNGAVTSQAGYLNLRTSEHNVYVLC